MKKIFRETADFSIGLLSSTDWSPLAGRLMPTSGPDYNIASLVAPSVSFQVREPEAGAQGTGGSTGTPPPQRPRFSLGRTIKSMLRSIGRGIYIIFFRPFVRPLAARLRGYLNEGRAEELASLKADIMTLQRQLHERAHAETHAVAKTIVQVIDARHEATLQAMRQDVRRLLQEMTQSWQLIRDFIKNDIRMASIAAHEHDKAIVSQLRDVSADLRKELASSSRGSAREIKESLTQVLGRVDTAAEAVRREIVEAGAGKASAGDVQKALRDILDGLQVTGSDLKKAVAAGTNTAAISDIEQNVAGILDRLQQSLVIAAENKSSVAHVSEATADILQRLQSLASDIRGDLAAALSATASIDDVQQAASDIAARLKATHETLDEALAGKVSKEDVRQVSREITEALQIASTGIRDEVERGVSSQVSVEEVRGVAAGIGHHLRTSMAGLEKSLLDAAQGQVSIGALREVATDIAARLQSVAADIRADVATGATGTASQDDVRQASAAILGELQATAEKLKDAVTQTSASKASAGDIQKAANDILDRLDIAANDLRNDVGGDMRQASKAVLVELQVVAQGIRQDVGSVRASLVDTQGAETVRASGSQQALPSQALSQLSTQLDRIETYGYATARRVAVPSGPDDIMVRTVVGYVMCKAQDNALIALLMETGDLEPGTRRLIESYVEPADTFIDVGANLGLHTLAAARAMNGVGQVIAFEPYGATKDLLERTIWMNGFSNMVDIHHAAVTATDAERQLFLGATSGHHSVFPLNEAGDGPSVSIRSVRLDSVVPVETQVNLIKIDVEGAELDVLESAVATINRNHDIALIVEFGPSHLQRIGRSAAEWFGAFDALGLEHMAINPVSGALEDWSMASLEASDSINLFFARSGSAAWRKAGVAP